MLNKLSSTSIGMTILKRRGRSEMHSENGMSYEFTMYEKIREITEIDKENGHSRQEQA